MAQKKQQQKSYILVYFVIALLVVILAVTGIVIGVVKHNKNKNNPTTAKAKTTASEETTKEESKEAVAKIQMTGDVLLHQTTSGDTISGAAKVTGSYDFHKYFDQIDDYINADMALCDIEGTVDIYGDDKDLAYYPQFNLPHEILPCLFSLEAFRHSAEYSFELSDRLFLSSSFGITTRSNQSLSAPRLLQKSASLLSSL